MRSRFRGVMRPLRRDQVDQATTSIALPLTRVSPFKLSTVT
jgi:hypothetical protein